MGDKVKVNSVTAAGVFYIVKCPIVRGKYMLRSLTKTQKYATLGRKYVTLGRKLATLGRDYHLTCFLLESPARRRRKWEFPLVR